MAETASSTVRNHRRLRIVRPMPQIDEVPINGAIATEGQPATYIPQQDIPPVMPVGTFQEVITQTTVPAPNPTQQAAEAIKLFSDQLLLFAAANKDQAATINTMQRSFLAAAKDLTDGRLLGWLDELFLRHTVRKHANVGFNRVVASGLMEVHGLQEQAQLLIAHLGAIERDRVAAESRQQTDVHAHKRRVQIKAHEGLLDNVLTEQRERVQYTLGPTIRTGLMERLRIEALADGKMYERLDKVLDLTPMLLQQVNRHPSMFPDYLRENLERIEELQRDHLASGGNRRSMLYQMSRDERLQNAVLQTWHDGQQGMYRHLYQPPGATRRAAPDEVDNRMEAEPDVDPFGTPTIPFYPIGQDPGSRGEVGGAE